MSAIFYAYPLIRRGLFALDPEAAHEATMSALQKAYDCRFTRALSHQLPLAPTVLMGLSLKNPVGLAAGLDKDGAHIDALGNLGFGFIEVGTVTPHAQPGNPKPRMFRLPESNALINRSGFNNHGLAQFLRNISRSEYRRNGGILGLNIGKNADTPIENAAQDYLIGLDGVYPHADYITINISSPNTKNLRDLQSSVALDALLGALNTRRQALAEQHQKSVPLTVKIAPDVDSEQLQTIAAALTKHAIDGVIATNTTISRQGVEGQPHAQETGGLSGTPVHEKSLWVIGQLRDLLGPTFPIIGVGGIISGQQAAEKMQAGAHAVQIYTGLIYRGPGLITEAVKAIQSLSVTKQ